MPKYKNIRVKKPNGSYRTQRVQVLASGKYKFVKNKPGTRSTAKRSRAKPKPRRTRAAPTRRRRTYVARRRKKRTNRKPKIHIVSTSLFLIGIKRLIDAYREGGTHRVLVSLTGYDPNYGWNWKWADAGIAFFGAGAAEMVISKSGMRRYIRIPWFTL